MGTNCVSAGVAITIIGAAVERGRERVDAGGDRGGGRRRREAGQVGGGERKGDRVGNADMAAERVLSWPVANRAVIHFAFSRAPLRSVPARLPPQASSPQSTILFSLDGPSASCLLVQLLMALDAYECSSFLSNANKKYAYLWPNARLRDRSGRRKWAPYYTIMGG